MKQKSNMYLHSKFQWNVVVGCRYNCKYCEKSFQAQMRRQIHNCSFCGIYVPHFHEERLTKKWVKRLPRTYGEEFIWCCSSSDIYFAEKKWINAIIEVIETKPERTFFFQTKNPECFKWYNFPKNVILGTTLETNRDTTRFLSKAPIPFERALSFRELRFPRKIVTIEPIMEFDLWTFVKWIENIAPERVYVGYDTRKCNLLEPSLMKTKRLIQYLEKNTKVYTKYMKGKVG